MLNRLIRSRLFIFLVAAFIVRIYGFNNPVADWHSWRQADTSAVSRNFIKFGFDLLHPRFDDLSNVPSGLDNPHGYRFVEFPIYNIFQVGMFKIFDSFTIEEWGRLVSIFASLGTIAFLYLILNKYAGKTVGFLTAFFYAFLPYNIYYNRTILPDVSMVTAIMGGIYFFDLAIEKKFQISNFKYQIYFILSIIFTASAFLLKPYALFFTLPIIYLVFKNFGLGFIKKWEIWVFAFLTIVPLVFWRIWMKQYPEGIPVSDWLFNGGNIRFRPAFFRWIFYERITKLILGFGGIPLFILGFIYLKLDFKLNNFKFSIFNFQTNIKIPNLKSASNQKNVFLLSFLMSSLLYLFVIARGNVQHDYYQILIIPSIVIFIALGAEFILKSSVIKKPGNYLVLFILMITMFYFGWSQVKDYFNINDGSIVIAGEEIDKLIPQNAKIIANYEGNTAFLYQTKRQGWASFEKPIPEMIKMGANYLAIVNPMPRDYGLGNTYKIIVAKKEYILFNLNQKP